VEGHEEPVELVRIIRSLVDRYSRTLVQLLPNAPKRKFVRPKIIHHVVELIAEQSLPAEFVGGMINIPGG
jgi:hypothetical protein